MRAIATAALLMFGAAAPASAEIVVKGFEKIAFLGDSITEAGWANPAGYVRLVMAGLEANSVHAEAVPTGLGGNKSDQMLARLDRDVLARKPEWMILSCGVNDVWKGKRGVPLDDAMAATRVYEPKPHEPGGRRGTYKKNITMIIEKAQAAGVKPIILTATVIHEQLDSPENADLALYNNFLRQLARERNLPLADLNELFQRRIRAEDKPTTKVLTTDGVHMNNEGNELMAIGILRAFGLNEVEIKKAKAAWPPLQAQAAQAAAARAKAQSSSSTPKQN